MTEEPSGPKRAAAPLEEGGAARAWRWLKKWGGVVFGAIAAALLFALGAGWLWRREQRELGAVKDELAVAEAQRDIAGLTARRDALLEQADEEDERVVEIDGELAASRRRVVEAHDDAQGMSDPEVEDAYARLGFVVPLLVSLGSIIDIV